MPMRLRSLPSWERGLKCLFGSITDKPIGVAPFVGAWIEISDDKKIEIGLSVAPFVGAWIEMVFSRLSTLIQLRRSLRGSVD